MRWPDGRRCRFGCLKPQGNPRWAARAQKSGANSCAQVQGSQLHEGPHGWRDGRRILVLGSEPGHGLRLCVQDISEGDLRRSPRKDLRCRARLSQDPGFCGTQPSSPHPQPRELQQVLRVFAAHVSAPHSAGLTWRCSAAPSGLPERGLGAT